jgi:hypothetical protein
MTDDLVKRMRAVPRDYDLYDHDIIYEAADHIEKLENALSEIANGVGDLSAYWIARTVLEKKNDQ